MPNDEERIDNAPEPDEPLNDALAESEMDFLSTEKKPLSKSTVVVFGLILASAAGLYFMYARSGPQSAAASAVSGKDKQAIKQFLDNGPENMKLMESMLRNTQAVVDQFHSYPSMKQIPLDDLNGNPFRHVSSTPAADARGEDMEKKREEERLAALNAVQALRLQSILYGETRKACMINNALYREGQQVGDFVIERINPDAVVVKRSAYRFELRMHR